MHDEMEQNAWMARGNCRDEVPSRFFPSDGVGVDRSRQHLRDLPGSEPCLEYALEAPHRPRRLGRYL